MAASRYARLTVSGLMAPERPRIWTASLSFMVFLLHKEFVFLFLFFAPSPGPEGKKQKGGILSLENGGAGTSRTASDRCCLARACTGGGTRAKTDHTRRTTAARRGGIASERGAAAARSASRAQGKQALWLI